MPSSISPADHGPCEFCPVSPGDGVGCAGLTRPGYCYRAEEGLPEWLARIVEVSAPGFVFEPPPTRVEVPDEGDPAYAVAAAPMARDAGARGAVDDLADRVAVETCRFLGGCHCDRTAHCSRPTRPPSMQKQLPWPDVNWASCLACAQAGEHSPRVTGGR